MRKLAVLLLAAGGCAFDLVPPEEQLRGFKREELETGPSDKGWHAAILSDVRRERFLDRHLEDGEKTCPGVRFSGDRTVCVADGTDLRVFELRNDLPDQPYRIEETAFFCPKESVYYYHYTGGPRRYDVWLGPYRIERPAKKLDDYK